MKVRIIRNDFVIGSTRIPEGSILEMPPIRVDYLVLQGRGARVDEENSAVKPGYQRQDMKPEAGAGPPADRRFKEPVRKAKSYTPRPRRNRKTTDAPG